MRTFQRTVKVGKTEGYKIKVARWAEGEEITSLSVVDPSGSVDVVGTEIEGADLKVLLTGISEGLTEVHFHYTTPTRSDCYAANVNVLASCTQGD